MAQTSQSLNLNTSGGPTTFLQQIPVQMTASGTQLPIANKPDVSQIVQSDPSLSKFVTPLSS